MKWSDLRRGDVIDSVDAHWGDTSWIMLVILDDATPDPLGGTRALYIDTNGWFLSSVRADHEDMEPTMWTVLPHASLSEP